MAEVALYNRQRSQKLAISALNEFGQRALALVAELGQLPASVSVVFVSDRTMARLHRRFHGLAGPTDVITFHHGEIVISVETAAAQSSRFGNSLQEELEIYMVHGLLHLAGYDDRDAEERQKMTRLQDQVAAASR